MGTPSYRLTFEDAVVVWLMHWEGKFNHEIASHFKCNQGRISEVMTGKLHKGSREVAAQKLGKSGKKPAPEKVKRAEPQLSLGIGDE